MARRPRQNNRTILITENKTKHVAFSKRRYSVFKKASELCTLCAVEMALIIFSPGGKPYSFGNPSTESILNRIIPGSSATPAPIGRDSSYSAEERARREATMAGLNKQYNDLNEQLQEEKKREKELKKKMKDLPDIEKINNRDELMKWNELFEALRLKLRDRKEELFAANLTLGGAYSAAREASSSSSSAPKTDHHQNQAEGAETFSANAIMRRGGLSLNLSAFVPK